MITKMIMLRLVMIITMTINNYNSDEEGDNNYNGD